MSVVVCPAIFGVIAFAVFIDFKVRVESASTLTYVNYEAGFGLFTGAWIASLLAALVSFTIKPHKSLAQELGSDVKASSL